MGGRAGPLPPWGGGGHYFMSSLVSKSVLSLFPGSLAGAESKEISCIDKLVLCHLDSDSNKPEGRSF